MPTDIPRDDSLKESDSPKLSDDSSCGETHIVGAEAAIQSMQRSLKEERMPEQIGRYRILQPIGQGGMGQVFMAEQSEPVRRRVALKVIKTDSPTKEILARFEAERQALAMMDHQNIAKILDAGMTEDGRPYFAMELVKGVPITEYCDSRRLTLNERLELFVQTCRAIQHAHQKGIIHRDIKPTNVLVTLYDGKPVAKVIDFGLAKALQDSMQLTNRTLYTQYGQIVGTLAYMSPEQAEMNTLDVDTRTDVYSLGVIFYELLTGSTPITREKIRSEAFDRILALIRSEEATRPSQRLSESGDQITGLSEQRRTEPKRLSVILRGDLDWIAIKALDKDRTRRYDTPSALADDVERYLNQEAIEARPPSMGYRVHKAFQKHRASFIAGGMIVFLLVAGLVGTGTMWYLASQAELTARNAETLARQSELKERAARQEALDQRDRANNNEQLALKEKQLAEATAARSNYFLAIARWEMNRAAEAVDFLEQVPPQYRHLEWHLAHNEFVGGAEELWGQLAPILSVAWAPDGSLVASGAGERGEQTIQLWDPVSGKQISTIDFRLAVYSVCFSPDSKMLAVGTGNPYGNGPGTITLWNPRTGQLLKTLTGHTGSVECVRFSPDGNWLVSCGGFNDGSVRVWELNGDAPPRILKTLQVLGVDSVCFGPSGQIVAFGGFEGISVWDLRDGGVSDLGNFERVTSVEFSPDGSRLVAGDWDGRVQVWDLATKERIQLLRGHTEYVTAVRFSPDGATIASSSRDDTIRLWDVRSGDDICVLRGHLDEVTSIDFSPDGFRLVSGAKDKSVRLWPIDGNVGVRVIVAADRVADLEINRSGSTVAAADRSGVSIWDLQTTLRVGHIDPGPGNVTSLAIDPGGTQIATAVHRGPSLHESVVELWDPSSDTAVRKIATLPERVHNMSFSSDGTHLSASSEFDDYQKSAPVNIFNILTAQKTDEFLGHGSSIRGSSFFPDGKRLASIGRDGQVMIWQPGAKQPLFTPGTHHGEGESIAVSSGGNLVASGGWDNVIRLWSAATGLEVGVLHGHTDIVTGLSFSSDSLRLVSSSRDHTVRIWDLASKSELRVFREHEAEVAAVCLSPDASMLVSGGWDGAICIRDANHEIGTTQLADRSMQVVVASLSPDSRWIAGGCGDGTVRLWDLREVELVHELTTSGSNVEVLTFSPDDRLLACGCSDGTVWLWDIQSGQPLLRSDGLHATKLAMSRDGGLLAAASGSRWQNSAGVIRVWDTRSGGQLQELGGHSGFVTHLGFHGNGSLGKGLQLVAECGEDRFAWEPLSGQLSSTLESVPPEPHAGSPDTERWSLSLSGGQLRLVDRTFFSLPRRQAKRSFSHGRLIAFHDRASAESIAAKDWYSAVWHAARSRKLSPNSWRPYQHLQTAWAAADASTRDQLQELVNESLKFPKPSVPPLTADEATSINARLWDIVTAPDRTPSELDLELMQAVVRDFPRGAYFNTLGGVLYRAGQYGPAIDACTRSVELTPGELNLPGPHPGDLAFLVMSHFQLGNADKVAAFRKQLEESMKLDAFRSDTECQAFEAEVRKLLKEQ